MSWNEPYNYQEVHKINTNGQRIINLTRRYRPGTNDLLVFYNGTLARKDVDYNEMNQYTIKFNEDLLENDIVICQLQKLW